MLGQSLAEYLVVRGIFQAFRIYRIIIFCCSGGILYMFEFFVILKFESVWLRIHVIILASIEVLFSKMFRNMSLHTLHFNFRLKKYFLLLIYKGDQKTRNLGMLNFLVGLSFMAYMNQPKSFLAHNLGQVSNECSELCLNKAPGKVIE